MTKILRWLVLGLVVTGSASAQEKKSPLTGPIVYLWEKGAPLAQGDEEKDKPNLSVYLAPEATSTGAAVVVCPGGGYGGLAKDHEGHQVATYLNGIGVSAFVLSYRLAPKYHHPCMMLDVQRAVRTVRSRAAEWKVDPARIGVMGFSAGGHLTSIAVTHYDDGKADAEDPVDRAGCRPDFGILIYPVIVLDKPYTHQGSRKNLLGDKLNDAALNEDLSCEKRVTEKTPPCFLLHTTGDTGVPPENSIDFYLALRKAKVPAELVILEKGPHGFGMSSKDPVLKTWPDRLTAWLGSRGLLKKPAVPAPVAVKTVLWPQGAPGAVGEEDQDKPSITPFFAPEDKATGAACLVLPGGGYGGLMTSYEGDEVAQWLNSVGIHGFVLRYRLGPRYKHPAMLNDVNRAVRMVRSRAAEWKVDPEKIGVWGFSAGGHLAATAATNFGDGKADAEDPVEKVSSRPNYAIMTYPVISMVAPYAHGGSMKNLLGAEGVKDEALRELLSAEKQVKPNTPPCFLMHSWEDGVPAENSIDFYLALRKAKIPAELHVYEKGPHGYGLGLKDPVLKSWPERLTDWLRVRGLVKGQK